MGYFFRRDSLTKSGNPRFYFAREPCDEPVEQLPEGTTISESVNGVVSLTRVRPSRILAAEITVVEAELGRHPHSDRYRLDTKQDRLIVYERTGPDRDETLAMFKLPIMPPRERIDRLRADMDWQARFAPVLRFILVDPAQRTFRTERMCYRGGIDDWIEVHRTGPLERPAPEMLPALGTDDFFELY